MRASITCVSYSKRACKYTYMHAVIQRERRKRKHSMEEALCSLFD